MKTPFCFLLSAFCILFPLSSASTASQSASADPAAYILTLSTIQRGEWELTKEINASRPFEFSVPRLKGEPIQCTYAPLTVDQITEAIPLPRGGTALTIGTISCDEFNLSDFERSDTQYEKAQYLESPIMLPSHAAWISANGRATHLLYDRNPAKAVSSFQLTFRKRSLPIQESAEEKAQENELEDEEETRSEIVPAPDRRGKIERKRDAAQLETPNAGEEKRRLLKTQLCSGLGAAAYDACVRSMRTTRFDRFAAEQEPAPFPSGDQPSRRMEALQERLQNNVSPLLDEDSGGKINLEPLSEQRQRHNVERLRAASKQEQEEDEQETTVRNAPIIRKRASSVRDRRMGNAAPLCRNRVGIMLIECLQGLGIEISPRTVDEKTLKVYEEMQKEEAPE